MKNFITLLLVAASFAFAACHNSNEESLPLTPQTGTIDFLISPYEIDNFDGLTRAATSIESLAHLDMAVYDAVSDELVTHIHQIPTDEGYGQFSATLPFGSYNIVFLGYEGSRQANVETPTSIYFPDNFVPHMFYKTIPLTISTTKANTQPIALTRCVGGFIFNHQGELCPANLDKISISVKDGSHHFNALTGKATNIESRTYTYDGAKVYAGKDNLLVNFYTFLTSDEEVHMNFTVSALDEEQKEIRTRSFENVPMKINQRTSYTGDFFAKDESVNGFQVTIENKDWIQKEYEY